MVGASEHSGQPLTFAATGGSAGRAWLARTPDEIGGESVNDTVLFGGDFCPGLTGADPTAWRADAHDAEFFSSVAASASYSIVNLEAPLGRGIAPTKSGYQLFADAGWAAVLAQVGVDAVCLANNHTMDQGIAGLEATLAACEAAGLSHFGAGGDTGEACEALLVRLTSCTVAIVAVAEHEFGVATRTAAGVCPLSMENVMRLVRLHRSLGRQVVVLVHGGNQHYALPRPGLRETCRFLVDCGAAAVVCAHSHIAGPLEWYSGTPILYGLGNLYFPIRASIAPTGWSEAICAMLGFDEDGTVDVTLVPTRFDGPHWISAIDDAAARELGARLEALSRVVADDDELEREWARHVEDNKRTYLSGLFGLTRLERLALRAGIWPWWRMPRRRTAELLDLIRCESHREVLLHLLENAVEGR